MLDGLSAARAGEGLLADGAGEAALRQTAEFSAHTHANPHDVAAWLRYVAFQPAAAKAAGDQGLGV